MDTFAELTSPQLLLGLRERDDAAVWQLDNTSALVFTVDFSPPAQLNATYAGALSMANALNDVYATGGRPVLCLNILGLAANTEPSWTDALLESARVTATSAGALVVGGHTIQSVEALYGAAVLGFVSPERVWRLDGAVPDDVLLLTKPLGSGVLLSAASSHSAGRRALRCNLRQITTLHDGAITALARTRVNAATDISGFGLAGHACAMAEASGVSLRVNSSTLPLYPSVRDLLAEGWTTRITDENWAASAERAVVEPDVEWRGALFDPQTSGPLLLSVHPADAEHALAALHSAGYARAVAVGRVLPREETPLRIAT